MKILNSEQIKEIDRLTILREPVTSYDLMERAAGALTRRILQLTSSSDSFLVISGPGNNGGDGLAAARMLFNAGRKVRVILVGNPSGLSPDCTFNLERLKSETEVPLQIAEKVTDLPLTLNESVIVDAIFGTGLSRKPADVFAEAINLINRSGAFVVSVDLPSGLSSDGSIIEGSRVVKSSFTLTFEFPRLSFLLPDTGLYAGNWETLSIGLDQNAIEEINTDYYFTTESEVRKLIRERGRFSHKGTFGHSLLIAGSEGKTGAAILSSGAALRSGTGLLTVHTPAIGYLPLNSVYPEAMISRDPDSSEITVMPDTEKYDAIAIGPGMDISEKSERVLFALLSTIKKPLVIDADGLNILAKNKKWYKYLGANIILTPHPGEFDRLAGNSSSSIMRLSRLREFSTEYNCYIVLKGAYTAVAAPGGSVFFNSTGNNGMATGGSGDVLTGIILSLLSQGYNSLNAAITGVWIHGKAGDIAAVSRGYEALIASDIIDNTGEAFKFLITKGEIIE